MKLPRERYTKTSSVDHKTRCNHWFTKEAIKACGSSKSVIVLDAAELQTSRQLVKAGFTPSRIHVPNPFIYSTLVKRKNTPAQFHSLLVFDLIADAETLIDDEIGAVWLDYCCSFDGNSNIRPRDDLKALFSTPKLAHNAYIALTFSYRGGGLQTDDKSNYLGRVLEFLTTVGQFHGRHFVIHKAIPYAKMFFVSFHARRITRQVLCDNDDAAKSLEQRFNYIVPRTKTSVVPSNEPEYEVESIMSHGNDDDGKILYKVSWVGYSTATWEPIENLYNSRELLITYNRTNGLASPEI